MISAPSSRQRGRTLAWSLALSAWGPPVTAIAAVLSRSSTQLADCVRRSTELVAIAVAFAAHRRSVDVTATEAERARWQARTRTATRAALAVSGFAVLAVAVLRGGTVETAGPLWIGLSVAMLGLAVNAGFWRRYARLQSRACDPIVTSQRVLFRAKCLVDAGVVTSLTTSLLTPGTPVARAADLGGAVAVAAYLIWSAFRAE